MITYGQIDEGILQGRKVILAPRDAMPENIFLVEKGVFFNGSPHFALHCVTKGCEREIPSSSGCPRCNQ